MKTLIYSGVEYSQYLISENGDVYNLKTNKWLKKSYCKGSGYLVVYLSLGKRGKVKGIRIHKAVAETFIPNPNNKEYVNHIDEDKTNCSVSNLEWVSARENKLKYLINHPGANNRKLTAEDVKFILDNCVNLSITELSKMFNVSKTTIFNVIKDSRSYATIKFNDIVSEI